MSEQKNNCEMEEHWEQWHPHPNLSLRYNIDSIRDDLDDFRLLLTDEKDEAQQLWVIYDKSVRVYRSTDESYRLATIAYLDNKYGGKFYSRWTFFKVTNSLYIRWLEEESGGSFWSEHNTHFAFIDDNSIVDVVTTYEPRLEFVTLNSADNK